MAERCGLTEHPLDRRGVPDVPGCVIRLGWSRSITSLASAQTSMLPSQEKAHKLAAPRTTVHGWRSTFRDWLVETIDYPEDLAKRPLCMQSAIRRAPRAIAATSSRSAVRSRKPGRAISRLLHRHRLTRIKGQRRRADVHEVEAHAFDGLIDEHEDGTRSMLDYANHTPSPRASCARSTIVNTRRHRRWCVRCCITRVIQRRNASMAFDQRSSTRSMQRRTTANG